jgi:phospholipid/cholesterol/gamma-HCH transport system substrate-binding protein
METSKFTEYKVGLFVVVAVAICLGFILALGGGKSIFKHTDVLHLKAEETNGLSIGAVVQVAGLPCGNISNIAFEPKSGLLDITLKIDHEYMARVTQGSVAGIHTQGALGDKYISIRPGPVSASPMKDGDMIESEPAGDLISTLGKSGGSVEKAFAIIDEVEKLTHELNQGNIAKNLSESAKNLKGASASLNELLVSLKGEDPRSNKLKAGMEHFASIMEKIDKGRGTLGGLINDPTVHEDLKDILGGAKRSKVLKYLIHQAIQSNDEEEAKQKSKK